MRQCGIEQTRKFGNKVRTYYKKQVSYRSRAAVAVLVELIGKGYKKIARADGVFRRIDPDRCAALKQIETKSKAIAKEMAEVDK